MQFTTIAIISALFAAIASILARFLLINIKTKDILSINFLMMAGTLFIISPLFYSFTFNNTSLLLLVCIASIDTLANYLYFKTFEKTEASIATPLLSLAPAFTFFFGILILQHIDTPLTYFLSAGILILILIFSIDFKQFREFKSQTLIPGLLSSFLFGISAIPSKMLLDTYHATNAPTLFMYRALLIGAFASIVFRTKIKLSAHQYISIFVRGLFVIAQWVLLYFALSQGSAGVSVTLGNITPIFVFILSMIFLHEKPTLKKIITSILILLLSFAITL